MGFELRAWWMAGCCLLASGCASETVIFDVDLNDQRAFLHTDVFEVTMHAEIEGEDPLITCNRLERESITSTGFTTAPRRRVGPIGACDFLQGAADLDNLPERLTHYVVTAKDASGNFIAFGCESASIRELSVNEDGTRRLVVPTEFTTYWNTTLAPMEPPYPSIEARCGSEGR
jgi:hypothetical protein